MENESLTFGEAAMLIRETVQPKDVGSIPYIGLEHIEEGSLRLNGFGKAKDVTSTKFRFSRGDVLFGKLRPYFRKVIRAPFDGVCSTDIWVVRANPNTNQGYLYYWMASKPFVDFATRGSEGTRMPRAKWEHVSRYEQIRLPVDDQRAIAHILGSLDDKIELNQRMNETLEAMAQAIFKSWFVDFDPVRAKAEGRDPGLPKDITSLFPDSFEDSDLGEIPKGWKVGTLDRIAVLKTKTVQPKTVPKKRWEHYSIPAFDSGKIPIFELGQTIKSGKYRVPVNSVLASKLNPQFPRVWLPNVQDDGAAICSTEFMPFEPTHATWRPFLYELMKSNMVQREILARVTGTTGSRQRVKPKEIAVMSVLIPPQELIDSFSYRVCSIYGQVLAYIQQSIILAKTRDTLLSKLLSGELRVPDAGKLLESVI